ncbi:uncharacterized protein LOC113147445 [Cyclospora cayetanensis]|uniref:Uncharacterized protein LOC113147445 n=1 Tax=Cyclospora cayetanensis TaxID=88456 RepID=A0A6P6S224_9EIME|nr:uncharacterized protein LOC113147445 [Cyclospora cayetanensis]
MAAAAEDAVREVCSIAKKDSCLHTHEAKNGSGIRAFAAELRLPEALLLLVLLRPTCEDDAEERQCETEQQRRQQQQSWTWNADDLLQEDADTIVCRLLLLLLGRLPDDDSPLRLAAAVQQLHAQAQQSQQRNQQQQPDKAAGVLPLLPWWVEAQLSRDSNEQHQVEKDVERSFTAWRLISSSGSSSNSSSEDSAHSSGSFLSVSDEPLESSNSIRSCSSIPKSTDSSSSNGERVTQAPAGSSSRMLRSNRKSKSILSKKGLQCLRGSLRLLLLGLLSRHLPTLAYAQGMHDIVAALLLTAVDALQQLTAATEVYKLLAGRGICCASQKDAAAIDSCYCSCTECCSRANSSGNRRCGSLAALPCGSLLRSCMHLCCFVGAEEILSPFSGLSLVCCHLAFILSERVCLCCVSDYLAAPFEASLMPAVRLLSLLLQQQDPQLSTLLRLCSAAAANTPGAEVLPCVSWLITWFTHSTNPFKLTARLLDSLLCGHPLMVLYVAAAAVRSQRRRLFAVFRSALADCRAAQPLFQQQQQQQHSTLICENGDVAALCEKLQHKPELIDQYRDQIGDAVYGEVHAVLQRVHLGRLSLERLLVQAHDALLHEVTPDQLLAYAAADGVQLLPFSPLQMPGALMPNAAAPDSRASPCCCCARLSYKPAFFDFVGPSMPPVVASYTTLAVGAANDAAAAASEPTVKQALHDTAASWAAAIGGAVTAPIRGSLPFAAEAITAACNDRSPCCCYSAERSLVGAAITLQSDSCPALYKHVPVQPAGSKGWRQPLPSVFVPLEQMVAVQKREFAAYLPVRLLQNFGETVLLQRICRAALAFASRATACLALCTGAVACLALLLQWLAERALRDSGSN